MWLFDGHNPMYLAEKRADSVRKSASLVAMAILFFLVSSVSLAGDIRVFVNGADCGLLDSLSIDASSIQLTAGSCGEPQPPVEPPPDNPVDPACTSSGGNLCHYFKLPLENTNYTKRIEPDHRHVYHVEIPASRSFSPPKLNMILYFSVVDHGAEVSLNIGISKIIGRVSPEQGEASYCYTGPGTELSFSAATDAQHTKCLVDFGENYYFTVENLDDKLAGDYRLSLKHEEY